MRIRIVKSNPIYGVGYSDCPLYSVHEVIKKTKSSIGTIGYLIPNPVNRSCLPSESWFIPKSCSEKILEEDYLSRIRDNERYYYE